MLHTITYTYHLHNEGNTKKKQQQQKDMKRIHLYDVQFLHFNPRPSKETLEPIQYSLNLDGNLKNNDYLSKNSQVFLSLIFNCKICLFKMRKNVKFLNKIFY